ncbi:Hsp70 family protein [Oribacterium sp. FC2011]|uniref:Hsp70 family protein n=1 Tax=Oribacterium sp. FC2011 TaxID=1408311 RepID=UPI0004E16A21|nr:Hsp70 family protein [Oribacterium sp. FC2011]
MSYVFGIDLGTTYSCISYIDEYGKAVVLKNSDGDHTTPSVVMVESENNIIVGTEAKRSIEMEPDKTVQFIKRKMGKENDTVVLNGTTYHAPEISSMILKKIVNDANEELRQTGVLKDGESVKDVVITCPAYFGMNERQATKAAGELAGLNVLNIINEPTAAAISYGVSGNDKNETVLVYDLGGGTFDITVMSIAGSDISVVCTGGDDQLGGKDWDEALMDYVIQRYEEENGEDLSEDPETIASLYVDVETWKKALTSREKVNISVNGPAGRFREELTREKYEELTSDLLNRTKNLLDDVLKTAEKQGYPINKIDKVLLVGGSSKMPQVAAMIEKDYGVTPVLADPDEAVAKGAAIYANNEKAYNDFVAVEAAKSGKTVDELKEDNLVTGELDQKYARFGGAGVGEMRINITNVLSRTYGIAALDENDALKIFNMLMINDKLPATKTETFYTVSNNQSALSLKIYESRSTDNVMDIEDREPITVIDMKFNRGVPQGTPVIQTLALDNSGILHIVAEEQLYHSRLDTTFQLSNQMTDDEMRSASMRMNSATIE